MTLELRHVSFSYHGSATGEAAPALVDLCFQMNISDAVGIVGPSGAGKSTFLQVLAGLEKPGEGVVLFQGKDVHQDRSAYERLRRQLGIVFQFPENQLFEATVAEDVAFGPRNQGLSRETVRTRVRTALSAVGLPPDVFLGRGIEQLSQGEKRRVAIAGVLAMEPQILLLDEPTAGLDPEGQRTFVTFLRDYHRRQKRGLVIASHDLDFLVQVVDRIYVMDAGRWKANVPLQQIETLPADSLPIRLPRVVRLRQRLAELGIRLPTHVFHPQAFLHALEQIPKL